MRDVTGLQGKHTDAENNAPASFVSVEIPGNPFYMTDIEGGAYLNTATGAVQNAAAAGFVLFEEYPGLSVPQIALTDQTIMDDLQIALANQDGAWTQVLAANGYRDSLVTVWQGQLDVSASDPSLFVFTSGSVKMYVGRLSGNLTVTRELATLNIKPHVVPFTVSIPYNMHDSTRFRRMPPANKKLPWGFDERTI